MAPSAEARGLQFGIIADDLSGAAELAGAARRYGLTADVAIGVPDRCGAEVCCVDTNSRSLPADKAAATVAVVAEKLAALRPAQLYKKTDSMLRGNVGAEIAAVMTATSRTTCLLCPANPGRQRIIRDGRYWIEGVPLDQSIHAHDPTHPRRSASVAELLGGWPGIHVPDVESRLDLQRIAGQVTDSTLAAGGVEFYECLLERRGATKALARKDPGLPSGKRLYVCGSPAAWSAGRQQQALENGVGSSLLGPQAADEICQRLDQTGCALLAIGDRLGNPEALGQQLAESVGNILQRQGVDLLLLEGGATAFAVLQQLGWHHWRAVAELAPGTVVLQEIGGARPWVVIKPGSYRWADVVWPSCKP